MKKAYLTKIDLLVRVVVEDHIDPEGEEFGEIVYNATNKRMKEEGISFINGSTTALTIAVIALIISILNTFKII